MSTKANPVSGEVLDMVSLFDALVSLTGEITDKYREWKVWL